MQKIKIKENSWLAKLAAWKLGSNNMAIVFGNTIYLYGANREEFIANQRWVRHELKHVLQYRQYGFAGFLFQYIIEWVKKGYYNNRFEIEARNSEADETMIRRFEFY